MSLTTVRNRVDNWLTASRWQNLVDRQEAFLLAHGKYFQGKWTHAAIVTQTDALTGDTIPTALADHPHDQVQDWRNFTGNIFDALPFPCRLRIDVYQGPQGWGWVACLQVIYNGNTYERSRSVGPDASRTSAWALVAP